MKRQIKKGLCALLVLLMLLTAALSAPSVLAAQEAQSAEETAQTEESAAEETTAPSEAEAQEENTPPADARANSRGQLFTTSPASTIVSSAADAKNSEELSAVTNLKTVSYATDKITLNWSMVQGASGYNIYYKSLNNNSALNLLTSVKGTSVTLHNVGAGTKWQFEVCAYGINRGNVFEGEPAVYQTGSKPGSVSSIWLTASSANIAIRWNKVANADGYILYREDASTKGKYVEYKRFSASTTSFTDTGTRRGYAYNYRIQAFIEVGDELWGGALNQLKTFDGLCAPGNDGTTTMLSKVYLSWNSNPYAVGYEIQMSYDNKSFSLLKRTSSTKMMTGILYRNQTFFFRIIPYTYTGDQRVYGTYTPISIKVSGNAYGEYVGNTYVEISIDDQHMWYYKDGKLLIETDVVTGNYGSMDTPTGYHSVQNKASPCTLSGPGYTSYVDYWIAFIGSGYGIHDASWRSEGEFGGNTYKGNGSHGCVNTPYDAVRTIYNNISVGTPVIVY